MESAKDWPLMESATEWTLMESTEEWTLRKLLIFYIYKNILHYT